ncbi:uncharacterized protein RHIMIDRAFT_241823 [Rhizopus microsporus ATCC 52813]|uniref:Uncharacterized protein n=1 Tax=Rhizopus microsporus ATCC 52813 TaxID=1340429 RepID=A0A2G4SHU1_RHIZD|nr:uncharacterized protein RHIMIDRAFT_241823 [Rhizopus microsporus ATCC 52813]PHZ08309.1 hypothetical protein RHIMIDRAFT_241823 [Rhizopus microsporus ATCC 52813]
MVSKITAFSGFTTYKTIHIFQLANDNNHFNSTHLNTLRSSITSVYRALHPNEKPSAAQPLIQDFFRSKKKIRSNNPIYSATFNLGNRHDNNFYKRAWADSANLYNLQLKTIALLCLVMMAWSNPDIGRLQTSDIRIGLQHSPVDPSRSCHIRSRYGAN